MPLDQDTRNRLQRFVTGARELLTDEFTRQLQQDYGMDPEDPLSWLYVGKGSAYTSLDAIVRVGKEFGGIWQALAVFTARRDAAYQ